MNNRMSSHDYDNFPEDKGCQAADKCVNCPLVICRYDHPAGLRGALLATLAALEPLEPVAWKLKYMERPEWIGATSPPVDPWPILVEVAAWTGVPVGAITGKSRFKPAAAARHLAMYRLRTETNLPLKAIGLALGNRDHSTVIHGVSKIEALVA